MKSFDINNIAEVKLIYQSKVKAADRPRIKCSNDACKLFLSNRDKETIEYFEEFKVLLLNRSNAVSGMFAVSKGGISGTVTDVRMVLQVAIKTNASALIIAHNHPSGNLNPSESDTRITQKIKESANLMDIQLLDHLIISPDMTYYSMADEGII